MGKLQRYFWPKTVLIFAIVDESIEAAFGFIDKGGVEIAERRSLALERKSELKAWYDDILRTYPRTYVASMLDTINQGALPECGKSAFEKYGVDGSLVHALCVDGKWMAYTSLVEMKWHEQKFKGIAFDMLFSPFVLIYEKSRNLLEERPRLFLLHRHGMAFLAVFSKEKLWYAQVIVVNEELEEEAAVAGSGEEDEALGFDLDLLDEEGEIAPINDVDVLGEFKTPGEEGVEEGGDEEALGNLEYTLNLFEEIKEAIARFYRDERYPHTFLEKVTLYDMDEVGRDLVRYIEDELFMEASLVDFDPVEVMAALVPAEIKG
ncbi:hypothetical protein [Hydrogenimonas sp. SS33]|uniref:hypothetical protein n=1 Tax=Hydrogenimonas leucolamina TaxID=2954236 RepID=UPI00336BDF05